MYIISWFPLNGWKIDPHGWEGREADRERVEITADGWMGTHIYIDGNCSNNEMEFMFIT